MSEKFQVILTPEAQRDIRETVLYIARELRAPQAALALEDFLRERMRSLSSMPFRIKTVSEQPWKDAGVRKTRVKNYYIYFTLNEEKQAVYVIAVIYTGRDQLKQMAERRMEEPSGFERGD